MIWLIPNFKFAANLYLEQILYILFSFLWNQGLSRVHALLEINTVKVWTWPASATPYGYRGAVGSNTRQRWSPSRTLPSVARHHQLALRGSALCLDGMACETVRDLINRCCKQPLSSSSVAAPGRDPQMHCTFHRLSANDIVADSPACPKHLASLQSITRELLRNKRIFLVDWNSRSVCKTAMTPRLIF